MDEEQIKKIAGFRVVLEDRIKSLESELESMKTLLDLVNDILIQKSFKRAEEISKPATKFTEHVIRKTLPRRRTKEIPLKADSGDLLATFNVKGSSIRITPASDKKFSVNMPPFRAFLVEKIFSKIQEEDKKLVEQGKLVEDKAFSYEITEKNDLIESISINNSDPRREREIRSAARWTFEKMFQKVK